MSATMEMSRSHCANCGRELVMARTAHGNLLRLDPEIPVYSVWVQGGVTLGAENHGAMAGHVCVADHVLTKEEVDGE